MFIHQDRSSELFFGDYKDESPTINKTMEDGKQHHYAFPELTADLFTLLFEREPKSVEGKPERGLLNAKRAIEQIKNLNEYQDLHRRTQFSPFFSGIGTEILVDSLIKVLAKLGSKSENDIKKAIQKAKKDKQKAEEDGDKQTAMSLEELLKQLEEQLQQLQEAGDEADGDEIDGDELRQAMKAALGKAMEGVEEADEAVNAFNQGKGYGKEDGREQRTGLKEKMALAAKIGKSKKLKEIAKLTGRMVRIAMKKQVQRCKAMEYSSVRVGDEIGRLLPSEYAKLALPELRGLFYQGLVERQLLEYQLHGKETKGRGAIIACLDESGSMSGSPECASKAIAMALFEIAKKQHRDFVMISFASPSQLRVYEVERGRYKQTELMDMLERFLSGGTCFETPLNKALTFINKSRFKNADVILITDGICSVSDQWLKKYKDTKKEKEFNCFGILIGTQDLNGVMDKFCDKTFKVADLLNDVKNDEIHDTIFTI